MRVLIYDNKEKDKEGMWLNKLTDKLQNENIEYIILNDCDLNKSYSVDALFSLGGDGTILFLTEFASKNNIPIIGINTGKLGFLTEFECNDVDEAVNLFKQNALSLDKRVIIKVDLNDKTYYALNDVFLHHVYTELVGNMINDIDVKLNDKSITMLKGDGIIVSTPTGSTAYSLSAGGPILSPELSAFVLTPIAPHTLNQRPIIYNADELCEIGIVGPARAGVFVDGKSIGILSKGDYFTITKGEQPVNFLRKKDYDFHQIVSKKLNNNTCKE
ncbi:MAG: NAD(+)/NADH kinase [Clostridia bacterium]|nr:NAD(+)/NADH kinase [Clostridia bacterium]